MAKITMADGSTFEGTISECVELSKVAAGAPQFSEGDYVRPMSAGRFGGVDIGALGEISNGPDRDGEYRVDALDGSDHDYFMPAQLERVTDADKAAAKASVAEAERWDEIGRKVNEFRKGDIVETTSGYIYAKGTLGVVTEVDSGISFRVEAEGKKVINWHGCEDIELITPVEDRFDR